MQMTLHYHLVFLQKMAKLILLVLTFCGLAARTLAMQVILRIILDLGKKCFYDS